MLQRITAINNLIELSFSAGLFVNAALFIPQGLRIIGKKEASSVSLITFVGFWIIQLTTLSHGFLKKDYLLAYGTLISMLTCGYVIWLIIYYRIKNKNGFFNQRIQ